MAQRHLAASGAKAKGAPHLVHLQHLQAGDGYIRLSRTAPDDVVEALRLTLGDSLREREWRGAH